MKQHKWHKEIKAWADGAEIEYRIRDGNWHDVGDDPPEWNEYSEYRIKPQPKEPQYFYVWKNHKNEVRFLNGLNELPIEYKYIGKIKLGAENE